MARAAKGFWLFLAVCLIVQCVAGLPLNVYAQLADSPWPMFRHDSLHTGRSPYIGAQKAELKWRFKTKDDIKSSPAIGADGTIYEGSYDNCLYAIDPEGKEKWRFETRGAIPSSPAIGTDGTIYVGSYDNCLYAIDPEGKEKWRFETRGAISSSPAIGADGTIYVGSHDNYFYAIGDGAKGSIIGYVTDKNTGEPIQKAQVTGYNEETVQKFNTKTDKDGYYQTKDLYPGIWHVKCTKRGYEKEIKSCLVESGKTTRCDFELTE